MDADTRSVFQPDEDTVVPFIDQHHLGIRHFSAGFWTALSRISRITEPQVCITISRIIVP